MAFHPNERVHDQKLAFYSREPRFVAASHPGADVC